MTATARPPLSAERLAEIRARRDTVLPDAMDLHVMWRAVPELLSELDRLTATAEGMYGRITQLENDVRDQRDRADRAEAALRLSMLRWGGLMLVCDGCQVTRLCSEQAYLDRRIVSPFEHLPSCILAAVPQPADDAAREGEGELPGQEQTDLRGESCAYTGDNDRV